MVKVIRIKGGTDNCYVVTDGKAAANGKFKKKG